MTAGFRRNACVKGSFPFFVCVLLSFEKSGEIAGNLVCVWRWNRADVSVMLTSLHIVPALGRQGAA